MQPLKTLVVQPHHHGCTLVDYLAEASGSTKKATKRLIDAKRVRLNGKPVWIAKYKLRTGDTITLPSAIFDAQPRKTSNTITPLHQAGSIYVFNKPAGLPTNGNKSFEQIIQRTFKDKRLKAIHRLDKETTGCLIFANNPEVTKQLIAQFRERSIEKSYQAIAVGHIPWQKKSVRSPIDHKEAITHIHRISTSDQYAYVRARIETGRKHQIRIHLAREQHPVAGDLEYAPKHLLNAEQSYTFPRQMLHAEKIRFDDPASAQRITVHAPLPADMQQQLSRLKLI